MDQLLAGRDPEELFAKDGFLAELEEALSERMLSAELDDHLDGESADGAINRQNGSSRKTMLTGTSKVTLDVPRDWAGTFYPKLIAKYQRRFPKSDDKIISMYARGKTVREIRGAPRGTVRDRRLAGSDLNDHRRLCRAVTKQAIGTPAMC